MVNPDWLDSILFQSCREFTADKTRLEWCERSRAEYVTESGTCGCIARVTDIEVTGMVDWSAELLAGVEMASRDLWGEVLA